MQFYSFSNSILVISRQWEDDNERLCDGISFTIIQMSYIKTQKICAAGG